MSIDRIATAQQTRLFSQPDQQDQRGAEHDQAADRLRQDVATTYAGFGDQTQVLTATISANARNDAYTDGHQFAITQADMQDTQLTSLSAPWCHS